LQHNKVKLIFALYFSLQNYFFRFSKVLTTLSLGGNEIGDQGAQHLAKALEQNEVMLAFYWIIYH
jgi:hypothetical protein